MKSVREEVRATSLGESPTIIRIRRKQSEEMPERKLEMVLKYVSRMVTAVSFAMLVLHAGILKLIVLGLIGIFFLLVYFGMKD